MTSDISNKQIIWIYEETGVGKTHYVWEKCKFNVWTSNNCEWYDGYENDKNILFDFVTTNSYIIKNSHELIKLLGNKAIMKIKGRPYRILCDPETIYFTSLEHPKTILKKLYKNLHFYTNNIKILKFEFAPNSKNYKDVIKTTEIYEYSDNKEEEKKEMFVTPNGTKINIK
jgi:hypothetical protein